jgi:hypothetical protein
LSFKSSSAGGSGSRLGNEQRREASGSGPALPGFSLWPGLVLAGTALVSGESRLRDFVFGFSGDSRTTSAVCETEPRRTKENRLPPFAGSQNAK